MYLPLYSDLSRAQHTKMVSSVHEKTTEKLAMTKAISATRTVG